MNSLLPISTLSGVTFRSLFISKLEAATALLARVGFVDDASAATPSNGIYFEASLATSGKWTGFVVSGGSSNSTAAGPAADMNFHTFEIRNAGNGTDSIQFWVDSTLVGTLTTGVPNHTVLPFFQIERTTSTTRNMDIDAFQFDMAVSR